MIHKKYLNISEVSKILQIEEHKIRYWDSIDPKTKKLKFIILELLNLIKSIVELEEIQKLKKNSIFLVET